MINSLAGKLIYIGHIKQNSFTQIKNNLIANYIEIFWRNSFLNYVKIIIYFLKGIKQRIRVCILKFFSRFS